MRAEQITGVVGEHIVSATNAPLLTSVSTPWSGFLLEIHAAGLRQDIVLGDGIEHTSAPSPTVSSAFECTV
jgi:hypothetical protein